MIKKGLVFLWLLTALSGARKGQGRSVSLGNGRWVPIAGSREQQETETEPDFDHEVGDDVSESRRIQIYAKPPSKLVVHNVHADLPYDPPKSTKLVVHNVHPETETYFKAPPYEFGYEFKDDGSYHHGAGSHQWRHEEGGLNGSKKGSYGYKDALGIYRHVDYIADEHGFRVTIRTNEPGTGSQNSAGVAIRIDPSSANLGAIRKPLITKKPSRYPILPVYRSNRVRKVSNVRRTDVNLNLPDLRRNLRVPQATAWYPMYVSPRTSDRDTIFRRWL